MLLYSTILNLKKSITKEEFAELVIEWNQNSPYEENIISDLKFEGDFDCKFGDDNLSLEFAEAKSRNTVAVRYEKIEGKGIIWDTDYVINFDEMKIAIQLDRSYTDDVDFINPKFSAPQFINYLEDRGLLADDGEIPVSVKPHYISKDNADLLNRIIEGKAKNRFPVIYVSKRFSGGDPLDLQWLSKKLKGIAHVFVQESEDDYDIIRNVCNNKNAFDGTTAIYFPHEAYENKLVRDKRWNSGNTYILRSVQNYLSGIDRDDIYSWYGVINAKTQESKAQLQESLDNAEGYMLDELGKEMERYLLQIDKLKKQNERLNAENIGLKVSFQSQNRRPILFGGDEEEFFSGETKEFVLMVLEESLKTIPEDMYKRKYDVIKDVLESNESNNQLKNRKAAIKSELKNVKRLNQANKNNLKDQGFEIDEGGKHYKLIYNGDSRYTGTMSKTSSDVNASKNFAAEIANKVFG